MKHTLKSESQRAYENLRWAILRTEGCEKNFENGQNGGRFGESGSCRDIRTRGVGLTDT